MPNVIIYSTSTCHYCQDAKQFLSGRGIKFVDHDVGKDAAKRKEMFEATGKLVVPTIVVAGKAIVGFNEKELESALKT